MPEQRSGICPFFIFFFFKLSSRSDNLPCSASRLCPLSASPTHTSSLARLRHKSDFNKSILSHAYTTLAVFGHFFIASTDRNVPPHPPHPQTEAKASLPVICRETEATGVGRCVNKLKSEPQSLQGKPSAPHFTQEKHNPRALKQLSDRASVLHINLSCSQVEVNAKYRHTHTVQRVHSFCLATTPMCFLFVGFRNHSSHNIL